VNDVHAHLDEYRATGTDCEPSSSLNCYGGYARLKTKMNEIKSKAGNTLVLNMGDEFQVCAHSLDPPPTDPYSYA
jgi:5'-nucleotidase